MELRIFLNKLSRHYLLISTKAAPPFVEPSCNSRSYNFRTIFHKPGVGYMSNILEVYPAILVVIGLWVKSLREINGSFQVFYRPVERR